MDYSYDNYDYVCGVDEAGRGPLAGDVYAAAVILNPKQPIDGLRDSKKLSEKQREHLYAAITSRALAYAVGIATVEEIDRLNILNASLLAMQRAVMSLLQTPQLIAQKITPSIVLIDGNKAPQLDGIPTTHTIIRGDSLVAEISAASIVAKVERDRAMRVLDRMHPQYHFAKHKGYGTKLHVDAIARYGILPNIHRVSFAPVRHAILSV
jgi:ribonuclease HII